MTITTPTSTKRPLTAAPDAPTQQNKKTRLGENVASVLDFEHARDQTPERLAHILVAPDVRRQREQVREGRRQTPERSTLPPVAPDVRTWRLQVKEDRKSNPSISR